MKYNLVYFFLIFIISSCKKNDTPVLAPNIPPVEYTYSQTYSTSQMIFTDFVKNTSVNDLNEKQFLTPLWTTMGSILNLKNIKKSNSWVGITIPLVNDFNNDGFQDLFVSFMSSENESIP